MVSVWALPSCPELPHPPSHAPPSIPEAASQLKAFAERWAGSTANEKAAFQTWMIEFCAALGSVLGRGPASVVEAHAAFEKGGQKQVERHLETLEVLGEVAVDGAGRCGQVGKAGTPYTHYHPR